MFTVKARSDDPFLRIRFLVPKTGSRRSDGPISRFRFCCENVGRSFAVCSHDPFFRTDKESSIWRQNDHAKFAGAFHLSRRVSDENTHICRINNKKRSHTQLDSRKQVIAFQDRVITINIKEAQHPLKREKQVIDKSSIMLKISTKSMHRVLKRMRRCGVPPHQ